MVRLKRRMATSNGSFSLTRTLGMYRSWLLAWLKGGTKRVADSISVVGSVSIRITIVGLFFRVVA
jgi:hypothetical protein